MFVQLDSLVHWFISHLPLYVFDLLTGEEEATDEDGGVNNQYEEMEVSLYFIATLH